MRRIKTTFGFKVRRLSRYTDERIPLFTEQIKKSICNKWFRFNQYYYEGEIYNSAILLKNLAIVHKDMPVSVDFMLEELIDGGGCLKNIYSDILSAYRNGKGKDSFHFLYEKVPTWSGKHFALLLEKIEQINPIELTHYINAFVETLLSERKTEKIKLTDKKSLVVTAFSTISIFMIMLNFTVVVVFMDALQMLGQLV